MSVGAEGAVGATENWKGPAGSKGDWAVKAGRIWFVVVVPVGLVVRPSPMLRFSCSFSWAIVPGTTTGMRPSSYWTGVDGGGTSVGVDSKSKLALLFFFLLLR